MTGWKTKTGAVLIPLGEALKQVLPPTLDWIGHLVGALGMAFAALGIGHKIEKASHSNFNGEH